MAKHFQMTIVVETRSEMTKEELKDLFDDLCFESPKVWSGGVKDVAEIEREVIA